MTSISESLRRSESILARSGVAEPGREAVSLVMLATARDRTFIYAHPEYILSEDEQARLDSMLDRRARREPLQYISGVQEFFGLEFEVTPDVLIPRPETEMLVEHAIEFLGSRPSPRFCEIGVGSGCIAVSILRFVPHAGGLGIDRSRAALKVAQRNSEKHLVADRLRLIESDAFDGVPDEHFDLIVSNPPYVPLTEIDRLQPEVRDFEPQVALTDGADGVSIIQRIIEAAPGFLHPKGALLLEIGIDQDRSVARMFDKRKWSTPTIFPDLQGIPRVVFNQRN
jgi:release factor glutamine methyltransferase